MFADDDIVDAILGIISKVAVEEGHSLVDFDKTKDTGGGESSTEDVYDDEHRDAGLVAESFEQDKEQHDCGGDDAWDEILVWYEAGGSDAHCESSGSSGGDQGKDATDDAERFSSGFWFFGLGGFWSSHGIFAFLFGVLFFLLIFDGSNGLFGFFFFFVGFDKVGDGLFFVFFD